MATNQTATTQQTPAQQAPRQNNLQLFNQTLSNPRTQDYLQQVLGEKRSAFVNNITALVANSKALQECEPLSIMYAGIKATALDLPLDPNLGFAYVIPFRNNKEGKTEAQFQIGYKGFIQMAIRSGQFKTLNVNEIKEGELMDEDLVTGEIRFRRMPNREELKTIGYVAYFRLINGFEKMLFSTVEQVTAHAKKYSQTFSSSKDWVQKSSKWSTDFDAMAKKTVIKMLISKYAPLSIDMQSAVINDQGVIGANGVRHIDNDQIDISDANTIDAEFIQVDTETGEIIQPQANEPQEQPEPPREIFDQKPPF